MATQYVGEYTSATTSQTGCVLTFMSEPWEKALFPSYVTRECPNCTKVAEHLFKLNKTHTVGTEKQLKTLNEWCKKHDVEVNVKVQ